ncbi:MAG: permease-like cell division protein FtsX [Candidatus Polarisedimenticolaceae bacterium]|nr:permease-like cell division protein FtsX [Candidatus Polarisedimenticolaceae bacterium]
MLKIWVLRHIQVSLASLGRLVRLPLSTLMTSAVIGIALALPTGMHVALDHLQAISGGWDGAATISLFLKQDVEAKAAERLTEKLQAKSNIAEVEFISREAALEEFRQLSGFGEALDALNSNPLPALLVIKPTTEQSDPLSTQQLIDELEQLSEADLVQLDMQWVRRFHALTEIAQRGVFVLASLLGLAVLLIIGNTIRLEIQNRHAEIEISKLIGATDAFIRRPFLYAGFWYGLFGGVIACLMVNLSILTLDDPVGQLASLYHSSFSLSIVDLQTVTVLLTGSSLLGLLGSWISVGRHLSTIEPS